MVKNKKIAFEDKELEILRNAVDRAEIKVGKKINQSNHIEAIIKILEDFLRHKKLICYGGTAINNILPENYQFYNRDAEIPDYDFYSSNAISYATELADIYSNNGYDEIVVRAGMHEGTYKVFVNFIPIADITQMDPKLFKVLLKKSIKKDGIFYAPPDFLRLSMYNELSRPDGDVSRWEKVYKRLVLLNEHFPMREDPKCSEINFMRDFAGTDYENKTLYNIVKDTMINEGVIFIGGYASSLYGKYMPETQKKQLQHVPDFDVLAENPKEIAYTLKNKLEESEFKNIRIVTKPSVGDGIIMTHYEVLVNNDTLCFIYGVSGCYSFNEITLNKKTIKVATIETMLLFLLSFMFSDRPYYDNERIMCMAQYLINVQSKNRLEQKGLLKRFNVNCYGKEKTIIELRSEKAEKYEELKNMKNTKEFDKFFYKYVPSKKNKNYIKTQTRKDNKTNNNMTQKKRTKTKWNKFW